MKISKQARDAASKIIQWQNRRITGEFHIRSDVAGKMLLEDIQQACNLYYKANIRKTRSHRVIARGW